MDKKQKEKEKKKVKAKDKRKKPKKSKLKEKDRGDPASGGPSLHSTDQTRLQALRNSVVADDTNLYLYKAQVLYPLRIPTEEIMDEIRKKLERTHHSDLPFLNILTELSLRATEESPDYCLEFFYGFFKHWRKIIYYTDTKNKYNEWSQLITCLGLEMFFYTDLFCPYLLRPCFNDDMDIFIKANAFFSTVRPDISIGVALPDKMLWILAGEAARQNYEHYLLHKDEGKLRDCMRACIDEQIEHLPLEYCCVFGLLHGGSSITVYIMQPEATENSDLLYYKRQVVKDRLRLTVAQDLLDFFSIMQEIERRARLMVDNYGKRNERNYKIPARNNFIEKGSKTHSKSSSTDQNENNTNIKPSKSNNEQNKDTLELEAKLFSLLPGRVIELGWSWTFIDDNFIRVGQYTLDSSDPIHIALVEKTCSHDRETIFLNTLRHKNIVTCYGSYVRTQSDEQGRIKYILMLERLKHIEAGDDPKRFLLLARDIASGLAYLHSLNIMHRDLKPKNILQTPYRNGCAKIVDFDLAKELKHEKGFKAFGEGVGTTGFIAPEVLKVDPKVGYDFKADIYSYGKTLEKIFGDNSKLYHSTLAKLVDACIKVDPTLRPSARAIVKYLTKKIAKYSESTVASKADASIAEPSSRQT